MAYVRTRLGRLFYEERGKSKRAGDPAIVLLHGLLFDGGSWNGQIEPLSSLGRVIVFDGPGHGRSEPPPRFTLEEHADALIDAFGELGISHAVLVGLSWGGMLSLRIALQHARSVAGLAILDASADAESFAEKVRYRAFVALHRRVGMPKALFLREVAPLMFAERTIVDRPDLIETSYQRTMGFDREGVARASLAVVVHRTNVLDRIGAIRAPTLVLCGREDQSCPPSDSEDMARRIPGAHLVVLDGLGHMSALEDPAAVNEHLLPFVDSAVRGANRARPAAARS